MAIAAFVISVLALLTSSASVWYIRLQAKHAGEIIKIEKIRIHAETTPTLTAKPSHDWHNDLNEHLTPVDVTNTSGYTLYDVAISAISDRPDKYAIIRVDEETQNISILVPGETQTIRVWLAHLGARAEVGILRFSMHNKEGDEWQIETELSFPQSPHAYRF
jgi:hypothetical protein